MSHNLGSWPHECVWFRVAKGLAARGLILRRVEFHSPTKRGIKYVLCIQTVRLFLRARTVIQIVSQAAKTLQIFR